MPEQLLRKLIFRLCDTISLCVAHMPQRGKGQDKITLWLHLPRAAIRLYFLNDKVAKCCDASGVTQFLWKGEKDRNIAARDVGQNMLQFREIICDVVWKYSNAQMVQHCLQHPEIVVDSEGGFQRAGVQLSNKLRADTDLGRGYVL